jgi:glycerate 2-kinase
MTPRELIVEAFRAACARVDLPGGVAAALGSDGPFVVVAAGKAATAMLAGVRRFEQALVVVPRGSAPPPADPRVTVMEAAHPLPDESSVRAGEAALALAAGRAPEERLFLISGGASSLLCAPVAGVDLARAREIVAKLLESGAPIGEVNVVRRHLSRIKGGGLARACGARPRRTLIVSDVIDGAPHAVGSGPSVEDPTTLDDARRIAARLGLGSLPFVETWKHPEKHAVVASPLAFAELVADELSKRGFEASAVLTNAWTDADELARRHAKVAPLLRRRQAVVFAAEPTVRVGVTGARGGRCTHLAALMASRLPEHTTFAAIASDGVDGSSGTGGAVVDGPLAGTELALARFATGPLHLAAGTALPEAPTGVNFADVHVLLRA